MTIPEIKKSIAQLAAAQEAARDAVRAAKIAATKAELEQVHTASLIAGLASLAKAARAPAGRKKPTKGR